MVNARGRPITTGGASCSGPLANEGKSYAAANALAARLAAVGVLEELTGQKRNRLFAYRQYIRIFEDDPE